MAHPLRQQLTIINRYFQTHITNCSTHILTPSERSILSKGLSFIPTPIHPHRSLTPLAQVTDIYNKNKYFHYHPYIAAPRTHPFHKCTTWTAPTDNSAPQPPLVADNNISQIQICRNSWQSHTCRTTMHFTHLYAQQWHHYQEIRQGGGIKIMNTTLHPTDTYRTLTRP